MKKLISSPCIFPQKFVTSEFDAEKWCGCLRDHFDGNGRGSAPNGHDSRTTFNFRGPQTRHDDNSDEIQQLMRDAVRAAVQFADLHLFH